MTVIGPGNVPENNGQHVDTYSRDLSRPDVPETPFLQNVQEWLLHHSPCGSCTARARSLTGLTRL
ncbi:MAG: hypothetical protein M3N33_05235 [Actinomycetota bacterium]|nr:hypothetical protein [Actinomycetota bacterium]